MSFSPFCLRSSAAWTTIQAKMPVVKGQPIVALCFLARATRISFIVVFSCGNFPHYLINFDWCRYNDGSSASAFAHFVVVFLNFWKPFAIIKLLIPCRFLL